PGLVLVLGGLPQTQVFNVLPMLGPLLAALVLATIRGGRWLPYGAIGLVAGLPYVVVAAILGDLVGFPLIPLAGYEPTDGLPLMMGALPVALVAALWLTRPRAAAPA